MKRNMHFGLQYFILPALWICLASPATKPSAPVMNLPEITVGTRNVTDITSTTADCYFTVSDPSNTPKRIGVCINKSTNPTISNTKFGVAKGSSGPVTFRAEMKNLTPNFKYYVRAFCTTTAGTIYGNEISFTTAKPK